MSKPMHHFLRQPIVLLFALTLVACGEPPKEGSASALEEEPVVITNRIDVPSSVRKNLGITFATVALRNVRRTRRMPGRFEYLPKAHRSYHSTLAGNVDLRVEQYQVVKKGDILFVLNSPAWREMQQQIAGTIRDIRKAAAQLASLDARTEAAKEHASSLVGQQTIWVDRVADLRGLASAGGGVGSALVEARAQLAAVKTSIAEVLEETAAVEAERAVLTSELTSFRRSTPALFADALPDGGGLGIPTSAAEKDLALSRAASYLGVTVESLQERGADGLPRWRTIETITVSAQQDGIVETLHITNGAWISQGDAVVETVDRSKLRFRALGLQSDLGQLRDGLVARILPPGGRAGAPDEVLQGTLTIGLQADARTRQIDLIVTPELNRSRTWARAGVSTEVEVVLGGTSEPELAVPVAAVIQDGLHKVIFRRDPKNADKVIRLEADLGVSDGRWVVVESGVMEGDQIVHHGVYELMLASGGAKQEGGHFHSDGTFHAGNDH